MPTRSSRQRSRKRNSYYYASPGHWPTITASLDELGRRLQALGQSELRLFGLADAAAFYVDGKRSILEIRDAVAAEYDPVPVDILVLYFRAFEKAGVMKIREK